MKEMTRPHSTASDHSRRSFALSLSPKQMLITIFIRRHLVMKLLEIVLCLPGFCKFVIFCLLFGFTVGIIRKLTHHRNDVMSQMNST